MKQLPPELIIMTAGLLHELVDVYSLGRVCKRFYKLLWLPAVENPDSKEGQIILKYHSSQIGFVHCIHFGGPDYQGRVTSYIVQNNREVEHGPYSMYNTAENILERWGSGIISKIFRTPASVQEFKLHLESLDKLKSRVEGTNWFGMRHGVEVTYWSNGKVHKRDHWKKGKRQGTCEIFFENGERAYLTSYVNGVINGVDKRYYNNGEGVQSQAAWQNGKLIGLEQTYDCLAKTDPGFNKKDDKYDDPNAFSSYHGRIKTSATWKDGVRHGDQVQYWKAAEPMVRETFENGKLLSKQVTPEYTEYCNSLH